ncbi:MAG: polysulfide reductase [Candidatus Aminicenantes bacterium]|nr:MAG: polysulfide reductase [Candidatus Aminicenantes bacterium]
MFPELTGFLFPNDVHILWSMMIVMYPYITGLVAGAFLVSSLYHVFGREEFKPLGRFALATALCFLAVAGLPLLNHLGHPERALNIVVTPNFTSAMAGFGILYASYFIILLFEVWFVFRVDIIETAARSRGLKRLVFSILALGVYDVSPESQAIDKRITRILAAIGIPMACLLHGYVGFLFGAVKANPWWSTPLMPVIFLFSAMVSGIALLIVLYQIAMKLKGMAIDRYAIAAMSRWLWLFLIMSLTLELLEIMMLAYERAEEWEVISHLLTHQLSFTFISLQMVGGGLIPLILLGIVVLMDRYMDDRIRNTLSMAASLLLLLQVLSMRWNVVIGGQMFSKSMRGFREAYIPGMFEKEGILAAALILFIPFVLLLVFERVLPTFRHLAQGDDPV